MILLFILMAMVVLVMVVLLNPDFWQGYRNSKFIDDYLNMDKETKGETNEETNELDHSTNAHRKD